jgi:TonB family protein
LSSAEDMNLLTSPPTAEHAEPTAEPAGPTAKPAEPAAESGLTAAPSESTPKLAEPPFEDTPVEMEEIASPAPDPKPLLKANMVAQEVRVMASGTPPDKNALDRQLFAEETTSVLICETGGVIQLSAAVSPGQLLVLTNFESKREVVAQVKRKRAYRPTICYVELEFAEAAPRFWGMEFSAASALLPKNALDAKTAEIVMAAEATADEPGELPAGPTIEQLDDFKHDVAVLRGQPAIPQTTLESVTAPPVSTPSPAPPAVAEAPVVPPTPTAPESSATAGWSDASASASSNNSLPVEQIPGPAQWPAEDQVQLSPQAQDFMMALPKRKRSLRARGSFTPNFRGGVLRLALLTAALLGTAFGAAWFKHWLPWQSAAENSLSTRPVNAGARTSLPSGSAATATPGDFSNTRVASDAPITSAGTPSRSAAVPNAEPSDPKDGTESSLQPSGSNGSGPQPVAKKNSPSTTLAAKRTPDRTTAKAVPNSVAVAASDSNFVPPKLIKSVRAVASLEALRDFETGNVVIDAVVGTAGEVNFISVLSGPPSLRPAAVESLKEYQYEPATRNGQPVPAHVTITIHFRFEP